MSAYSSNDPASRSIAYLNGLLRRLVDIFVSLLLFFPGCGIVFLMAVAIRLESRGNPFFAQIRVGRNGKAFRLWKMRTLYADKFVILDRDAELKSDSDRITRVGRWLRRTKLDEIPQLLNVLVGHMSLIGPRPDIPQQVATYRETQRERLLVRPGLTGIAQVSGNTEHSWDKRIEMDRWYISNASPLLDAKILWWTIGAIFSGEDGNADPSGAVAATSDPNIRQQSPQRI